jgi:FkbM family methyltransferase
MLNWRMVWGAVSSRVCPPIYRYWRFNELNTLSWANLPKITKLEPELLILPEFLAHPGCFLDIGANNGAYLWAALRRKPAKEVVAVEPIPFLAGILKHAFRGVAVHNLALTDGVGPRWLKIPDIGGRTYTTRATLNVDHKEDGETGNRMIQVETSTLDAFWKSIGDPELACIKIDTEGHEFPVLQGAVETLKRHRPVLLVEIEQRHHKEDIRYVFEFMAAQNYAPFYFDPTFPGLRPLPPDLGAARAADPDNTSLRYLNNFLFLPPERSGFSDTLALVNRRLRESARPA